MAAMRAWARRQGLRPVGVLRRKRQSSVAHHASVLRTSLMRGRVRPFSFRPLGAAISGSLVVALLAGESRVAADASAGTHIVRTICPGGQLPAATRSGCSCATSGAGLAILEVAPPPDDPTCLPLARAEGPYCLWSCGHPMTPKVQRNPRCHDGAGTTVACPNDDEFLCSAGDCSWKVPPGAGCDSPPNQRSAACIYHDASGTPGPPPTSGQLPKQTASFIPPASVGEIYVLVDYAKSITGQPLPTKFAVVWGTWQHHDVISPAPGARGFALRLRHVNPDAVPLLIATTGVISWGPVHGARPPVPGYSLVAW
jgi:hypothetical protein